ncbi:hypothetical protein ACFFMN_33785 [Planobispora siamensis]|uniref:Uncharacterized protein n=1 Tax=Planobispora siamensis TaxID=936338 RepID=A0A8J3SFJ6_9ACTN|nr:hypothetical protein [Planobispora siamensis]GIH91977.1 hypothetical protein Psi01_26070 [Planobispora siamensis]
MIPTGRSRTLLDATGCHQTLPDGRGTTLTPAALHAALDNRRRQLGLKWWQVAIEVDTTETRFREMRNGTVSPALRQRAEAWLERRPVPPRTE